MFKPINQHFGHQNGQNGIENRPEDVVPPNPPEALGQNESFLKIKLGTTQFYQIPESDNTKHESKRETLDNVCASDLKKIVLFEFLEDAAFDFYELIRNQQREQSMIIRIDGDIQGDQLVNHNQRMHHIVQGSQYEEE